VREIILLYETEDRKEIMENSTKTTEVAVISTLEAEGFIIGKLWKSICKADNKRFKDSINAEGFDYRLGKLMVQLKAEGGQRISSQRLKDCNIHEVDKRRRSEALWFVENEIKCREFIAESKKGFGSLTALQAAMAKSAKADNPAVTEGDNAGAATEGGEAPITEGVAKSNVGPVDLAKQVADLAKANGVSLLDLVDQLLELATGSSVEDLAQESAKAA
jgi:hypothetical protein